MAIDVANKVESLIKQRGAYCAFPINICINHQAAHYTPSENDPLRFARGDLVKLDIGVHVNGYIADTATTVEVTTSNWTNLIKASADALNCALEMLTSGIEVRSLGEAIETAIKSKGYLPVKNLTGHSMERNLLHAGITVPNVATRDRSILKSGMAVAIEPFATNGKGEVDGNKGGNIYKVLNDKKLSDDDANRFLSSIISDFNHLPFSARWCAPFSKEYEALIRKHWRHRNLQSYAILSEVSGGMVAQTEHSALIFDGSVSIYTR